MLTLDKAPTKFELRSTKGLKGSKSLLFTGMPGVGKTTLAVYMLMELLKLKGVEHPEQEIFALDFPEEDKGVSSLSDYDITFGTIGSVDALDEAYAVACKMKPQAILFDGLPAAWKMFQTVRVPSLVMPEDRGKTWNLLATDVTSRLITRFRMIPSVYTSAATSTEWPDKDEMTGQEGRIQVTLPGQLKGNIYGLFSICLAIRVAEAQGRPVRTVQTQPDAKTVAKMRAPIGHQPPRTVTYDLADANKGAAYLAKTLNLA